MRITESEIEIAAKVAGKAADAVGIHLLADSTVIKITAAPAIIAGRMGTMLTSGKIETFAKDLFERLDNHPSADFELEDKFAALSWKQSKKQSIAENAILHAGVDIPPLHELKDTKALYESLQGAPNARRSLTNYANATQEFRAVNSQYNKAFVGPQFADVHIATAALVQDSGLFKPQLKLVRDLEGAQASYSDGTVRLGHETLTGSAVTLVQSVAHEMTHLEQDLLQIGHSADQMGIGTHATEAQIKDLEGWFKEHNVTTTASTITKGLAVRDGRYLTDEAAERADTTINSMNSTMRLSAEYFPIRQRIAALGHFEDLVIYGMDTQSVLRELGDEKDGLALNILLFGADKGPGLFLQHFRLMHSLGYFSDAPKPVQESVSIGLRNSIESGLAEAQAQFAPYVHQYKTAAHEVEAFSNGDLAASFHKPSVVMRGSLDLSSLFKQ